MLYALTYGLSLLVQQLALHSSPGILAAVLGVTRAMVLEQNDETMSGKFTCLGEFYTLPPMSWLFDVLYFDPNEEFCVYQFLALARIDSLSSNCHRIYDQWSHILSNQVQ